MFLLCTLVGNILLRTCSTEQEREEDAKCSDFCDQNQLKPADLSPCQQYFSPILTVKVKMGEEEDESNPQSLKRKMPKIVIFNKKTMRL